MPSPLVLRAEGDLDGARSAFEAALRISRRNGLNIGMAGAIAGLACLAGDAASGPQLGRPIVDRIHGSKIHNLKLRPRVPGGAEVRLLFVFDPEREAIVLVAGDKAGRWSAWYAEAIPRAEERYAAYRQAIRKEEE